MRSPIVYSAYKGVVKKKKTFSKVFLPTLAVSLLFAGIVGLSSVFATTQVSWNGQQGLTNGALTTSSCDNQSTPYILWLFTLGGGTENVTSATLHLGGSGSGDFTMSKTGHEMKATTPYFDLSTLTATASYVGTLGNGNSNLTISHGCAGGEVLREVTTHLTLVKYVVNDNGGTADASEWTLAATGDSGSFSGQGSPAKGTDASIGNDVTAGVEYTLSESGGPFGYLSTGVWICNGGGTFVSPDKITLAEGDDVTCAVTNDDIDPVLTLVKQIINDNNGKASATDWNLSAAGPTPISGATGDAAVTSANVDSGTYNLSESGGPSGYTASDWSCVINNGAPVIGASVNLGPGDVATCTITNDDNLTVVLGCNSDRENCDGCNNGDAVFTNAVNTDNEDCSTDDPKDPSTPVVLAASTELTNTGTPITGASLVAGGILLTTIGVLGYNTVSNRKKQ